MLICVSDWRSGARLYRNVRQTRAIKSHLITEDIWRSLTSVFWRHHLISVCAVMDGWGLTGANISSCFQLINAFILSLILDFNMHIRFGSSKGWRWVKMQSLQNKGSKRGFSQKGHRRTNFRFPKEPFSEKLLKENIFLSVKSILII